MGGEPKEFGRGGQIGLRSQDVVMAHIGGKPRKASVEVNPLSIPSSQAMPGKGVAKVIGSRSDAASVRLQACFPKEPSEGFGCRVHCQSAFIGSYKETIARFGGSEGAPNRQILVQLLRQGTMKRHPPSPPFECLHKKNPGARVHISHTETKRFAKAEPSAVEKEKQGPVQNSTESRSCQLRSELEESPNVLLRENVRNKCGLGREPWPARFTDCGAARTPSQVQAELA